MHCRRPPSPLRWPRCKRFHPPAPLPTPPPPLLPLLARKSLIATPRVEGLCLGACLTETEDLQPTLPDSARDSRAALESAILNHARSLLEPVAEAACQALEQAGANATWAVAREAAERVKSSVEELAVADLVALRQWLEDWCGAWQKLEPACVQAASGGLCSAAQIASCRAAVEPPPTGGPWSNPGVLGLSKLWNLVPGQIKGAVKDLRTLSNQCFEKAVESTALCH